MNYRIQNITYQYAPDGKEVLKDVSLEIRRSAVTAVVGPSGCGKTTLVDILSGVIPKLENNGVLQGELELGENALVSVVSQSPENQLFGYGVEDAIAFGMENMGLPAEEIADRMEYVLDLLNLQYLRKRSVAALSGGQRQSVCIASVLAMHPDILIMDEPVSSLDPNGKKMVQNVLNQLRADGTTVLIADNNLEWSAGIVDRVVGLYDGEVLFDGTKEEFFRNFELQEKLGVTIPQEAEIYRALAPSHPDLSMFYSMEGPIRELDQIFPQEDFTAPAPKEQLEDAFLTTHQLNKVFADGFQALKEINTAFPKGKVIAIMGQNGSGKTTLLHALERRGALVLDCDAVYHEMLRTDAPLRADLIAAFGDVFAPDGGLDRQKLGNIVFGDAGALAQLDAIIFRHLPRALARRMEESGARLIALDAIKLVESGLGALCDVTVAVTAPEEMRVRRIMTRDGISEDYARARVRAQRSEEAFRADCDAVFENNYPTPAQAAFAAEEFLDTIIKKSKEE